MNTAANVTTLPDSWPTLAEMGVTRFHEISGYALRPDGEGRDVLKIAYRRQKGSLLPESRKYRFGRSLKTVVADGGTARLETTYEISPYLLQAVAELDRLVPRNADAAADPKGAILDELDGLGRALAERLPAADAATLEARLAEVRRRVEAL